MKELLDTKVIELMNKNVVSVEMDDNLSVVKEIFDNTIFHHLLVIEKGQLFGIISDRDLFKAISPNIGKASESMSDTASLNKKAHQIMTRSPISVQKNAIVKDVIKCFEDNEISCVPIVNEHSIPVGIISWRDLLKYIKLYLESI